MRNVNPNILSQEYGNQQGPLWGKGEKTAIIHGLFHVEKCPQDRPATSIKLIEIFLRLIDPILAIFLLRPVTNKETIRYQ